MKAPYFDLLEQEEARRFNRRHSSLWTKILVLFGFRSRCCHAPLLDTKGYGRMCRQCFKKYH